MFLGISFGRLVLFVPVGVEEPKSSHIQGQQKMLVKSTSTSGSKSNEHLFLRVH